MNCQQDTIAKIDAANGLDKALLGLQLLQYGGSMSVIEGSPIKYLLKLLKHSDVTCEMIKKWLTEFLIWVLPALEITVKAILLTNLKKMVSCSIDPRIPDKYRKRHKVPTFTESSQEYGIDINIESIDFLNKLAINPLSDEGREKYFGLEGVTDVYKFARADDMDAFLWFVIHKGHFPNSAEITDITHFTDNIHGVSAESVKPQNGSLLEPLEVKFSTEQSSTILPGNTFTYANSPNVISMCVDSKYDDKTLKIVRNTLLPVSDDWNSVNWYIRRADQFGKNLGWGWQWEYGEDSHTVSSKKSRDYSKEKGICNLQFLDQAQTTESPLTGLINNKLRFTILPKPYVHVPSIQRGEPAWRFKKMLFNAKGEYDPNGKYSFAQTISEDYSVTGKVKFSGLGDSGVEIDIKSGKVTVNKPKTLVKYLFECYQGLTVYEFNYDYVMGMKLFDAKTIVSSLFDAIINTKLGLRANVKVEHQEATEELKEIIKNIVNSEDSTVSDCFYNFDNSKYDALLRKSEEKRARQERFGNVTDESGLFDNVKEILGEYDANAELNKQVEVLDRAITQAIVNITEGVDEENKRTIEFNFVTDLIEQLAFAIISSILSPKVLMLLEVNETLMGGKWEKITMRDVLEAMRSVITSIISEIRELIIQELYKLLNKFLSQIVEALHAQILKEQIENYSELIQSLIRDCPSIWFNLSGLFGNPDLDTKLDTVDYADINIENNQPITKEC